MRQKKLLISINAVNSLKTYFVGKLRVILTNYPDTQVMCSRTRTPLLKEWLNR
ncbi:MAG: LytTR family transcriptional regulator [Prevotella sp.]|nr:LytTR family transcriptional regulator [Prevotella sp.]